MPLFLPDSQAAAIKAVATTISAVSAAWIAAQGKLKFGELSEKYANVAGTYGLLTSEAYFRMTQARVTAQTSSEEDNCRDMLQFLEYTQNLEKNARSGCPLAPRRLEKKVLNKERESGLNKVSPQ